MKKERRAKRGLVAKRVVVTRAAHQSAAMANLLESRGAIPVLYPCIAITPPADTALLDRALRDAAAGRYDWLVITSTNVSRILAHRLQEEGLHLTNTPVAAIGARTAAAVKKDLRIDVSLVATEYRAEALAAELEAKPGQRILLPQSAIARPVLAESLRKYGVEVTVIEAYQNELGWGGDDVPAHLAARTIDAVTFTSSSTVEGFLERVAAEGGNVASLNGLVLAAIGPVTAGTMRKRGLPVAVMPSEYTVPALVEAMDRFFLSEIKPSTPDRFLK